MSEILVAILGFAGGIVAGLLGVGGGIIFVPTLTIILGESQLEAESTSLLAIVPVAIAGVIRQRRYGNVRLGAGLMIGALSIPGVVLGVVVANAVSQRALELGFAALLLVVAAQLVRRAMRAFCASSSVFDAATSKLASIREAVTFACWPPGPEERLARTTISSSGIARWRLIGNRSAIVALESQLCLPTSL